MESWQRKHIHNNLDSLKTNTIVNAQVLTSLRSEDLLCEDDIQVVKAERTASEQVLKLYDIMKTKRNGFVGLINALRGAHQSGAYSTLLTLSFEMVGNLQVGNNTKIRDLLNNDEITELETWLSENLSIDERIEMCNLKDGMSMWRDTIPAAYKLYIPRFLSRRVVVKPSLLEETCDDVFVFKYITRRQLLDLLPNNRHSVMESSGSQLLRRKFSTRFVLLDVPTDWDRICAKLEPTSVHLLRYEDTSKTFILEKTSCLTGILRKYLNAATKDCVNPEYCSEDQFLETIQSENMKGVCVCDLPGMGKTLLLANLARKTRQKYPDTIVSFVQLRNLELPQLPLVNHVVVSKFLSFVSASQLATCILRKLIENHKIKIEIFFDGLDEVEETKLQHTLEFIKVICKCMPESRVYVTSRQVVRTELENTLGIIAYDIVAFDEETQLQYLTSCWLANDASCVQSRLQEYGKICLESFKNNLKQSERDIAGIPLQFKLIAEVSMEQAIAFADRNRKNQPRLPENFGSSLTEIYTKYILRQFGKPKCNFDCIKRKFGSKSKQCEETACQVKCYHVWKSIQLIFPVLSKKLPKNSVRFFENLSNQKILSPGILEERQNANGYNTDMEFVHRTFAEYLVAEYFFTVIFTEPNRHEQQNSFQQLAFDQLFTPGGKEIIGYGVYAMRLREQVVAYFLDTLLSENHNKHILITCKANLSSFFEFVDILEGSMHVDSDGLLHVYIQAAENWLKEYIAPLAGNRNLYTASANMLAPLENVLQVLAATLSANAAKSLQNFFVEKLNIDLIGVNVKSIRISPLALAIRRGDFMLTEYLTLKQPLEGTIFWCVFYTYFETNELVERKLDIARMLIDKCPDLITNPRNFSVFGSPILAYEIHLKAFKFLIENGADIRVTRRHGENMIAMAAGYMSNEIFMELCEYLCSQNYENHNALWYFLQPELWNKIFVFEFLIERKDITETLLRIILYLKTRSSTNSAAHPSQTTKRETFLAEEDQTLDELLTACLDAEFYKNNTEILSILFHSAIHEGITTVAEQLLNYDTLLVTTTVESDHGPVPVLFSVRNADTLNFFVAKGASIFQVDKTGRTILHFLAEKGNLEGFMDVVNYLCTLGETIPTTTDILTVSNWTASVLKPQSLNELFNWPTIHFKRTPLHYFSLYLSSDFIIKKHKEALDVLLFGGSNVEAEWMANINAVDKDGNTSLLLSLCHDYLTPTVDFVEYLVHNCAELKVKNKMGCNAVHICAQNYRFLKHLNYFVNLGVDCNEIDSNGNNALQCGLLNCKRSYHTYKSCSFVKVLLDANLDKEHVNYQNKTAYDIAKEANFPLDILKLLKVDAIPSSQKKDLSWKSYFAAMAACGKTSLPESIGNLKPIDKHRNTALHAALEMRCDIEVIKDLIARGVSCDTKNNESCNVAHICAQKCLYEHMEFFMELGIDINQVDSKGNTALQCGLAKCPKKDYAELTKILVILVEAGTDIAHANLEKKTAYDIAKKTGHWCDDILEYLKVGSNLTQNQISKNKSHGSVQEILSTESSTSKITELSKKLSELRQHALDLMDGSIV